MITKKEAQAYIDAIIALKNSATDKQASEAAILYPKWEVKKELFAGDRIEYDNKLYKVIETHTS